MDHYRTLFEVTSHLCGHINPELKKTSSYALEAFLKQVKAFFERPHSDRLSNVHYVTILSPGIELN